MTKNPTKKINIFKITYVCLLCICIVTIVIMPKTASNSFFEGVRIWATSVLPALLPFFILTKLLSYSDFLGTLSKSLTPVTQKLYGVGGLSGYIYLMSIISGYPVGAKLTSDLYKSGNISKSEAHTITSFASTSGPLFIIGTVATNMFGNVSIGIIILISHIFGAMLNGLLYRNKKDITHIQSFNSSKPQNILNETMSSSIMSIMAVGGFIALFYMLLSILNTLKIFSPICNLLEIIGVDSSISTSIICGIIEVTSGAIMLGQTGLSFKMLTILGTILISFGGLSIHAQAFTYLKDFDMSYKKFFLIKLTHAIISGLISWLLVLILKI